MIESLPRSSLMPMNCSGIEAPSIPRAVKHHLAAKGTSDEAAYREWYAKRYHSPLDNLNQPWAPDATAKYNDFFNKLVMTLADAGRRSAWKAGSSSAK